MGDPDYTLASQVKVPQPVNLTAPTTKDKTPPANLQTQIMQKALGQLGGQTNFAFNPNPGSQT